MYRVYDKEEHKFVDDIFLSQDGILYKLVQRMFLPDKLVPAYEIDENENERFIVQYDTNMFDKYYRHIYEGDICKIYNADDKDAVGVVAWSDDIGSYCVFDGKNLQYYVLMASTRDNFEIIDNVCDGGYPVATGGDDDGGEDSQG